LAAKIKIHIAVIVVAYSLLFDAYAIQSVSAGVPAPMPPVVANAPQVQVLILSGTGSSGVMNITYDSQIGQQQVSADLAAISQHLDVEGSKASVTNAAQPVPGMQVPVMTSVTVPGDGLAPLSGTTPPLGAIVFALRRYHRLEIEYIMPPTYVYSGVRQFENADVSLKETQNGSTYIFDVTINNNNLLALNLPLSPATVTSATQVDAAPDSRRLRTVRVVAFVVILCVAILVGVGVYFGLSRKQAVKTIGNTSP
jgi:hypothetical protein